MSKSFKNRIKRIGYGLILAFVTTTFIPVTSIQLEASTPTNTSNVGTPNVVVFLVDDMGWTDLGIWSDYYETPALDKFVREEAVNFTDAYAPAAICSPSRGSILTGKSPGRLHLTDWIGAPSEKNRKLTVPNWTQYVEPAELMIPEVIKEKGYKSASIGKWHVGDYNNEAATSAIGQGFDVGIGAATGNGTSGQPRSYYYPFGNNPNLPGKSGDYLTDTLTDHAVEFIEQNKDEPFFLYLSHYAVHTPHESRKDYEDYFKAKMKGERHKDPKYAGIIKSVDDSFARIMETLEAEGVADNTIVIFTSDNGGEDQTSNYPLKAYKGFAFEGGTRVPLMIKYPGVTDPGTTNDTPVIGWDLAPTIFDVAGVTLEDYPKDIDGQSLIPLLKGDNLDREALYWHFPHYRVPGWGSERGDNQPFSSIRDGDYKLIEYQDEQRCALYNIKEDISETNDLALSMPKKTKEMWTKLDQWRKDSGVQLPGGYAAPEFDSLIIEDKNPVVKYSGTWRDSPDSQSHGGSHIYTGEMGAYAEIEFEGTGIEIYSKTGGAAGIADIYIDDMEAPIAEFDGYDTTPRYQVLAHKVTGLSPGKHKVRIQVSGRKNPSSSNVFVNFDYVKVTNDQPEGATVSFKGKQLVESNENFDVTVGMENLTGTVYSQDITLEYNPDIFTYEGVEVIGDNQKIAGDDGIAIDNGVIRILGVVLDQSKGLKGNADFFNFNFTANSAQKPTSGNMIATVKVGTVDNGENGIIEGESATFKINVEAALVAPEVNKTNLTNEIAKAEKILIDADIGLDPGQYLEVEKEKLKGAIADAKIIEKNKDATQSQVDTAFNKLKEAIDVFNASKIVGEVMEGDVNNDGKIDIADLALIAYYFRTTDEDDNWDKIKRVDVDDNGKIDTGDLVFVAKKVLGL